MNKYRKILEKEVPQFLLVWEDVLKNGFFTTINTNVHNNSDDDAMGGLDISATARIPVDKKYMRKGVSPYLDPGFLLDDLRHHFEEGKFILAYLQCEVKAEIWSLYDKNGEDIIGRKGRELTLKLSLRLEKARKKKKAK